MNKVKARPRSCTTQPPAHQGHTVKRSSLYQIITTGMTLTPIDSYKQQRMTYHIFTYPCAPKMPKQRKNTRSAQNSTIEIIFISYFKLCHLNFFDLAYPTLILTPKLSKSPEKLIKSNKKTSESSVCVLKYLLQTGKFTKKINKSLSNT